MNICGVLVHALPAEVDTVETALRRMPGIEVHARAEAGRIVVTVEDTPASAASDGIAAIHALPGVVSAALVYHSFEPNDPSTVQGDLTP